MCYFVRVDIVLQRDTPNARAAFSWPPSHSLHVGGAFPTYWVTDGHCACALVESDGTALKGMTVVLQGLLAERNTKRVHVLWYWGDEEPDDLPVERLAITDFVARNDLRQLRSGCVYRLHDPSKFAK